MKTVNVIVTALVLCVLVGCAVEKLTLGVENARTAGMQPDGSGCATAEK